MSGIYDPEIAALLDDAPVSSSDLPVPAGLRVPVGTGKELAIAGDAYDGASVLSREMMMYAPALRSADQDVIPAKRLSDARTRDMMRNDAYVQNAATLRKDNIVGSYYMLNSKPSTSVLFPNKSDSFREGFEEAFQEEIEEKSSLYFESPDNWCDASRHNGLTGMTRMAVDMHTVSGEVLSSAEWMRDPTRTYHTAMQMVDVDRLSDPQDRTFDARTVKGGVQRDKYGAALGYFVRMAHPADWLTPDAYKWKYVEARKPWGRLQMLHIFEQLRPDQTRGMSLMVAALTEMKMTKNFRKMVLQNAVLNATYAATIESELPTEQIFASLGGGEMTAQSMQNALTGYIGGHFNTISQFVGGSKNLQIDGVKIPHLPPGSKLNLRGAGQGGPLGNEFEQSLLRHIAAALGVSYEQLSKDYTQTNYSSARAAMNETHKAMLSIKKAVADRFAGTMFRLWFEEAFNLGEITTISSAMPSIYKGRYLDSQTFDAYTSCDWVGASRGQVDELKETQAAILRINNGLSDLETENARLGADWRRRMRQMKREMTWKEFYGVLQNPTDTTNQENAASGTKREKKAATSAHTPSPGTAANLFMDDEHEEEKEDA